MPYFLTADFNSLQFQRSLDLHPHIELKNSDTVSRQSFHKRHVPLQDLYHSHRREVNGLKNISVQHLGQFAIKRQAQQDEYISETLHSSQSAASYLNSGFFYRIIVAINYFIEVYGYLRTTSTTFGDRKIRLSRILKAIEARLQTATSSAEVYSNISVHKLLLLIVPRFC
jgi:hypothetical protein